MVRALMSTSETEILDHLIQLVNNAAERAIDNARKIWIDGEPAMTSPATERAALVAAYDAAEQVSLRVARALISEPGYKLSPVLTINIFELIIKHARIESEIILKYARHRGR